MAIIKDIMRKTDVENDYTILDEGFDYWVDSCRVFIDLFGLHDWEVKFTFRESTPELDIRARFVCYDDLNRICELMLYDTWDVEPDEFQLSRNAFHEVVHMLLLDLTLMIIGDRKVSEAMANREEHRIIRTLENVFWRPNFEQASNKLLQEEKCEGP